MTTAVLYSFRRCPYAMRARMALKMANIDYEHREVSLRNKPIEMLQASSKGTVPVFIRNDGSVIAESLDIMLWALSENDPESWLVNKDISLARIKTIDEEFKPHLDRYKYASRYKDDARRGDVDLQHRGYAEAYIRKLEAELTNQPYFGGEKSNLADMAIFPFIRQFANTDKDWWLSTPYVNTQSWLETCVNSALFKAIMTKYSLWKSPAA